jgi:cytochrome c oxidase subunit 2
MRACDTAVGAPKIARRIALVAGVGILAGCTSVQSTFSPFGPEAGALRILSIVMFSAAALIACGVLLLARHAVRHDEGIGWRSGMHMVLWLGGIGPVVLLTSLMAASLPQMRRAAAGQGALEIGVDAEQFWWRVRYALPDGTAAETANEIRIPVGRPVAFALGSPDVIHSFWIPGLAGKVDMIPGRTNVLPVLATRAGLYRGTCAEFCGLSHANMAFDVVAMPPVEFDRWLEGLARSAAAVSGQGRRLFDDYGCTGCHVVRGHAAGSPIGPDLTHFGSRLSFAAGTLPMTADAVSRFVRDAPAVKPGVRMPSFVAMSAGDADAISAYLLELR